jgi:hypothetical protein
LFHIQTNPIQAMELHHLRKPNGPTGGHPCSWEVHILELVRACQDPCLAMGNRNGRLSMPSHLVQLRVLPRSLIEVVLKPFEFVGN